MPSPPQWPAFEAPNLLVRLPERATSPTSRNINGESWSGVTRHYRLTPLGPGAFSIPAQALRVTWSDPDTGAARQSTVTTPAISFRGVIPEGAEGLDPFIAANNLTLTQEIDGEPDAMRPGDSLTRTIVAQVQGVAPMVLPGLTPAQDIAGLAAYPDDPVLSQTEDRGEIGGRRSERVVYVAEGGGQGALPEVRLDWYDIDAGEVATARLPAVDVHIDGPPAQAVERRDPTEIALYVGASLLGLGALALLLRRLVPTLRAVVRRRRHEYLASEAFAWRALMRAVSAGDHGELRPALDLWASRFDGPDPRRDVGVQSALLALGANRYGGETQAADPWRAVGQSLAQARRQRGTHKEAALPPLNPGGSPV